MIQIRIFVSGRVQGVGFRANTVRAAGKHPGLKGYVRNLPDDRVEAVFAGPEKAVQEMVEWCRKGPPSAQVTHVELSHEPVDPSLSEFEVK